MDEWPINSIHSQSAIEINRRFLLLDNPIARIRSDSEPLASSVDIRGTRSLHVSSTDENKRLGNCSYMSIADLWLPKRQSISASRSLSPSLQCKAAEKCASLRKKKLPARSKLSPRRKKHRKSSGAPSGRNDWNEHPSSSTRDKFDGEKDYSFISMFENLINAPSSSSVLRNDMLDIRYVLSEPLGQSYGTPFGLASRFGLGEIEPEQCLPEPIAYPQLPEIQVTLTDILSDEEKYRRLLHSSESDAQHILNVLQVVLDSPTLDISLKPQILNALLRTSSKSSLYPQCYTLKDVYRQEIPVTSGHYGDIYPGRYRGTRVCLKVVKMYQESNVRHIMKLYSREAILWAHLSHPNVLPFYGIYPFEDAYRRICLISPWMENGNITEYLNRYPDVCRPLLISDVAQGVEYLHSQKVIHGDLKGANILVSCSGRACLADFGLSTILDPAMIQYASVETSGNIGGTVRWQAPEVMNGTVRANEKSDIYAFACVCYEIFMGRYPFYEIDHDITVVLKVMAGGRPSPPPQSFAYYERGLTDAMWRIIEECWQQNSEKRPSMHEITMSLPFGNTVDTRPPEDWDTLASSKFRHTMHTAQGLCLDTGIALLKNISMLNMQHS